MKDKEIDKFLDEWRSPCCKEPFYAKGRADFRCKGCDKDVTLEIVLLVDAISKEK
jgi:hypothetical protein